MVINIANANLYCDYKFFSYGIVTYLFSNLYLQQFRLGVDFLLHNLD
jgi:hypothetical protein